MTVKELCTEGFYAPSPPCADGCEKKCPCGCCYVVGRCGFGFLNKQSVRGPLYVTLSALSVIQLIMGIAAACSLSTSYATVKNVAWTHVKFDGIGDIYSALHTVVVDIDDPDTGFQIDQAVSWDDFCDINNATAGIQATQNCEDCQTAAATFHVTAISGALSKLGQLATDMTRSRQSEDVNCQKFIGFLSGFTGGLMTLWGLLLYNDACFNNLPDSFIGASGQTIDVTAVAGPGFILTTIITIGGIADGLINVFTPTPEEASAPGYYEKRAAAKEATNNNMSI